MSKVDTLESFDRARLVWCRMLPFGSLEHRARNKMSFAAARQRAPGTWIRHNRRRLQCQLSKQHRATEPELESNPLAFHESATWLEKLVGETAFGSQWFISALCVTRCCCLPGLAMQPCKSLDVHILVQSSSDIASNWQKSLTIYFPKSDLQRISGASPCL